MTDESLSESDGPARAAGRIWTGLVIVVLAAAVVVLLGMLATSIMERRWEALRPALAVTPIADWEPDNAVWGRNYPREYETYANGRITDTRTKFGGAFPRDYLEEDPLKVILFAGYGFSKDYLQARGHYYAVQDVVKTKRVEAKFVAATCWTCKSTDVPRVMARDGIAKFYGANFHDLKKEITHPIGCQDCHDPGTMRLRITRPVLKEAYEATGRDISKATHQEMRSLVCAQCHVEYYFKKDPKNYLALPWTKGTSPEGMMAYYDEIDFHDYVHPVSGTAIVKSQHPDYELYLTGIHAYRKVSCADCHMPYRSEGGVKFTDHHVQSPLLNIANSCAVCHRWSEQEIRSRVESIQTKVADAALAAEDAVVKAHFDVAACMQAGATDQQLAPVRKAVRRAQF
ncbi:MAG: ammonia-forming cytochrome c nitrite reductase subunit c552, partial [Phycisphaerae bacterium]